MAILGFGLGGRSSRVLVLKVCSIGEFLGFRSRFWVSKVYGFQAVGV